MLIIKFDNGDVISVSPNDLTVIKPISPSIEGNDLEIITQVDGSSVDIKENAGYVRGKISVDYPGPEAGKDVMLRALDYTKRGDENLVAVKLTGAKLNYIKKKYLTAVFIDENELNEYGVYNSERDVHNNVKTSENKPSTSVDNMSKIIHGLTTIVGDLQTLKRFVDKKTNLSCNTIDLTIEELETYCEDLKKETKKQSLEKIP